MPDMYQCKHPNLELSAGAENEPLEDWVGVRQEGRVRYWNNEHCPDCGFDNTIFGPWVTE